MPSSKAIATPDQKEWAARIRDGDVAVFEAAFRAWYGELCSFVRPQVGTAEEAEEVVQEVFLRVWRARASLDPAKPMRAYLYRAARNTVINQLKRRQLESRWLEGGGTLPGAASDAADDEVRVHELNDAVELTLTALPERCRLIFTMSRHQGLSYGEIADVLGISIKTVETQMGRALKALRAGLAAFLP